MSEAAKDLLARLLTKDPAKRLGNTAGGVLALRDHPWFEEIEWELIFNKKIAPPYKPQLQSKEDTCHF